MSAGLLIGGKSFDEEAKRILAMNILMHVFTCALNLALVFSFSLSIYLSFILSIYLSLSLSASFSFVPSFPGV
jgi:hypothetical protein